jgi:hypothetical protein
MDRFVSFVLLNNRAPSFVDMAEDVELGTEALLKGDLEDLAADILVMTRFV